MNNKLYAVIDIGSNSAILQISALNFGHLEKKIQKVVSIRLGQDLSENERLILEPTLNTLKNELILYRRTINNTNAKLIGIVLTEAVRRAENAHEVMTLIENTMGLSGDIISGPQEANLCHKALAKFHQRNDFISIDLGAGSTDLASEDQSLSLSIGALRLQKELGSFPDFSAMNLLKDRFSESIAQEFRGKDLFFCGGTSCAFGMILKQMIAYDAQKLEGLEFTKEDLDSCSSQMMNLSPELISQFPGLEGRRSEIFIPGLRIMQFLVNDLNPKKLRLSALGLSDGYFIYKLEEKGYLK
jgi:exopolyphosphatase / guanosine-5'-triphosphate,3'-diphosphate pyrophosphatase